MKIFPLWTLSCTEPIFFYQNNIEAKLKQCLHLNNHYHIYVYIYSLYYLQSFFEAPNNNNSKIDNRSSRDDHNENDNKRATGSQ